MTDGSSRGRNMGRILKPSSRMQVSKCLVFKAPLFSCKRQSLCQILPTTATLTSMLSLSSTQLSMPCLPSLFLLQTHIQKRRKAPGCYPNLGLATLTQEDQYNPSPSTRQVTPTNLKRNSFLIWKKVARVPRIFGSKSWPPPYLLRER
jgi:hypothetical protein